MTPRTRPMRIRKSPLTAQFYAFNAYRDDGKALIVTGKKHDVTEDVQFYIADAIRTAQVEQRQRIIAIIKGGDRPWQELVDAILKQEE